MAGIWANVKGLSEHMIRIGMDTQSIIGAKTGIGCYVNSLVKYISKSDEFKINSYSDKATLDMSTLQRILWENIKMPMIAKRDKIDLLHIPGFAGPLLKGKYRKVTTVHDLIGMIYPHNLGRISRFYWQKWLPLCVKNSDIIIADSENTKNDIMRLLHVPADKITVIYLAADEHFRPMSKVESSLNILRKYGINKKYILNVGTIEPRKNIVSLVEAFGKYKKHSEEDILLVVAGKKGWDYQRCKHRVQELGLDQEVVFCDYVEEDDLPLLYSLAEVFVYPSFYEGFGLPVLEAMSCGIPVISSNVSSLPEITGDAALLIDPNSIDSIKAALAKILDDKQFAKTLSGRALERSRFFSWENTVEKTIEIYRKLAR